MLDRRLYRCLCICDFPRNNRRFMDPSDALVATPGGSSGAQPLLFCPDGTKGESNEFFGFYDVFGRFAAVTGPFLVGITTRLTGSTSFGVFSFVILFAVGLVVLFFVPKQRHDDLSFIHASGQFVLLLELTRLEELNNVYLIWSR